MCRDARVGTVLLAAILVAACTPSPAPSPTAPRPSTAVGQESPPPALSTPPPIASTPAPPAASLEPPRPLEPPETCPPRGWPNLLAAPVPTFAVRANPRAGYVEGEMFFVDAEARAAPTCPPCPRNKVCGPCNVDTVVLVPRQGPPIKVAIPVGELIPSGQGMAWVVSCGKKSYLRRFLMPPYAIE